MISDNIDACSREYPGLHFQHDKVMIVDGRILETGSFNYTPTAEKANSENILVLRHVPRVIKLYQEHFKIRWEYGVPYQKGDLA
ncbi:phospholipase D-like domain-containing protein [Buttiauxella noackiae]|uniref:phospholipase D-like domain-containing protein n=1 Tax=Buttiauxella noackiae TaxID=82992 RepID=UPI0035A6CDEE